MGPFCFQPTCHRATEHTSIPKDQHRSCGEPQTVKLLERDMGTGEVGLVTCPAPRELIQIQAGCSKGEQVETEHQSTSLLTLSAHPSPALHGLR